MLIYMYFLRFYFLNIFIIFKVVVLKKILIYKNQVKGIINIKLHYLMKKKL